MIPLARQLPLRLPQLMMYDLVFLSRTNLQNIQFGVYKDVENPVQTNLLTTTLQEQQKELETVKFFDFSSSNPQAKAEMARIQAEKQKLEEEKSKVTGVHSAQMLRKDAETKEEEMRMKERLLRENMAAKKKMQEEEKQRIAQFEEQKRKNEEKLAEEKKKMEEQEKQLRLQLEHDRKAAELKMQEDQKKKQAEIDRQARKHNKKVDFITTLISFIFLNFVLDEENGRGTCSKEGPDGSRICKNGARDGSESSTTESTRSAPKSTTGG